jgi:hypothetical protein
MIESVEGFGSELYSLIFRPRHPESFKQRHVHICIAGTSQLIPLASTPAKRIRESSKCCRLDCEQLKLVSGLGVNMLLHRRGRPYKYCGRSHGEVDGK